MSFREIYSNFKLSVTRSGIMAGKSTDVTNRDVPWNNLPYHGMWIIGFNQEMPHPKQPCTCVGAQTKEYGRIKPVNNTYYLT
jgi:hypothetical protein